MKKSILIVEDSQTIREILRAEFEAGGLEAVAAESAEKGLERLSDRRFDVLLTDLVLPGMDGLALLARTRREFPELPVVLMTAFEKSAIAAVGAIAKGASDYLIKPLKAGEALFCIDRILHQRDLEERVAYLSKEVRERYSFANLVGRNPAMQSIYETIEIVAETDSTVLITGETGTGKELVARAIHWASPRREKRFLTINCGALPTELLESELFGHERGAFTGAIRMKLGKFEYGDGGTIFLDEVGEIPPLIQVKILRVLQEREFERVGGNQPIKVDVRILAATNKDLPTAISKGEFREDLYYRLNVVPLRMPPLRERREDIPLLARHFVEKCREKFKRQVEGFSREATNRLMVHDWPGNVRELENVVERAVIMARGAVIGMVPLPDAALKEAPGGRDPVHPVSMAEYAGVPLDRAQDRFEKAYLEEILARAGGRIGLAARMSGLNPRTLNRKMSRQRLDKKEFKPGAGQDRADLSEESHSETMGRSVVTDSARSRS
jgi:DNA-binding NtrC family response regulator